MSSEKIITVLRLCIDNDIMQSNCNRCPFAKYENKCMDTMLEYVVRHIKGQQALLDDAKATLEDLLENTLCEVE